MLGLRYNQAILVLVIVATAAASNCIYSYTRIADEGVNTFFVDQLDNGVTEAENFLGGWPLRYYASNRYPDDLQFTAFSVVRLIGNVAIWLGVLAIYVGYCSLAKKRSEKTGRSSISVGDMFIATLIVALAIFYWQTLRRRTAEDRELVLQIRKANGYAGVSLDLPKPLVSLMPHFFRDCFYRLSTVTLESPKDELLQKVIELPNLSRLRIGGGGYDLRLLDNIAAKPLLQEVRLSGRKLDAALISAIGSAKQLQSINFMRTNVSAQALGGLGKMPALRHIDLTHTDVELTDANAPVWAENLRSIVLPHPKQGTGAVLKIHGWPNIKSLTCMEYDEWLNREAVQLELRELPNLKTLSLDALQLFDLELNNLPNLSEINPLHVAADLRVAPGQEVASFLWIRDLSVEKTPELGQLAVQGNDLRDLTFTDATEIGFGVGVAPRFARRQRTVAGGTIFLAPRVGQDSEDNTIPLSIRQNWVDGLAGSDGPRKLDYSHIPLDSVNLEPLSQNKSIRILDLSHAGVDAKQLVAIREMTQLEELRVTGYMMNGSSIAKFVDSFPNLQRLLVDLNNVRRIKLVDKPHLCSIFREVSDLPLGYEWTRGGFDGYNFANQWEQLGLEAVHLENLPLYSDAIQLLPTAIYAHLENVQSLSGLVFQAPIPERCEIVGLRDLDVFAGGGSRLNDAIAERVIQCENLRKLTIAHSSVSLDVIRTIGGLSKLKYLCLTGSAINDEVFSSWKSMGLTTLRLDQTDVGGGAVPVIARMTGLLRLWMDGIDAADLRGLARLANLRELHVGKTILDSKGMEEITKLLSIRELSLTECELDAEVLTVLLKKFPENLLVLNLADSKVDGRALLAIAYKFPYIIFDLTHTETDAATVDYIVSQGRLASEYADPQSQARNTRSRGTMILNSKPDTYGEINPRYYDALYLKSAAASQGQNQTYGMPVPPSNYAPPRRTPVLSFEALGYWLGRMLNPPPRPPRID